MVAASDVPEGAPVFLPDSLKRHRRYALLILMLVFMFSHIDRSIVGILAEPIKHEFGLSDTQLGVLTGFAFAIFYATLGIPLALLGDRSNRRNIIAIAIAFWSVMTAFSGFAANYTQLVLARIGVGIGEAGSTPQSHSMIADMYPQHERARALAFYSLGVYFGIMLGFLVGGYVSTVWGWRAALFVVGLPGLVLALVVRFTVQEPLRGLADGVAADEPRDRVASRGALRDAAAFMWRSKACRHVVYGATLTAIAGYGGLMWGAPFFERAFGLPRAQIGFILGPIVGIMGGAGALLGGYLADRLGMRDLRWKGWIVGIAKIVAVPISIVALMSHDLIFALAFYLPSAVLGAFSQGPGPAIVQSVTPLAMRATVSAILLFVLNLIGLGFGPLAVGAISDLLTPVYGNDSLRYALMSTALLNVWAGVHYMLAGTAFAREMKAMDTP